MQKARMQNAYEIRLLVLLYVLFTHVLFFQTANVHIRSKSVRGTFANLFIPIFSFAIVFGIQNKAKTDDAIQRKVTHHM
jgi:hypothetical protein